MDRISIDRLRVETIIGIHDWERRVRQPLILDVQVGADMAAAAAADDIGATVDYGALAQRVDEFVRDSEFRLLETLAERTAAVILDEFGVSWVRLRVGKPGAVTAADSVAVEVERSRQA